MCRVHRHIRGLHGDSPAGGKDPSSNKVSKAINHEEWPAEAGEGNAFQAPAEAVTGNH